MVPAGSSCITSPTEVEVRFFMISSYLITHYYHSGFSVAFEDLLFVFDYWRGENGELPPDRQISREGLQAYRKVYVFISHEHVDHLDPIVFTWKEYADVTYLVSSDMPVGTRGKRVAPGDRVDLEDGVFVTGFDSTDLGVSFLLNVKGFQIFHAGDLNFWHWRDESTLQEIEEAQLEFQEAVRPLTREIIDVAFFPVDPRQGTMFEAGANYFILSVKPRLLIPMHYFHRDDVAVDYARTASCRSTEVLAMPGYGDSVLLRTDGKEFLDISFPREEPREEDQPLEEVISNNPFFESDLPLTQLADPSAKKEEGTEETSDAQAVESPGEATGPDSDDMENGAGNDAFPAP